MKIHYPLNKSIPQKVKSWYEKILIKFREPNSTLYLILQKIHLGRSIERKKLELLTKSLSISYYQEGDIIIKEGETGDKFYFIKKGAVRVYTTNTKDHSEIVLARLEEGDFFGEQALLEEIPTKRMSNVRALTDCELFTLSHANYIKILNPQLKKLLKAIGNRQLFEMFCQTQEILGVIDRKILKNLPGKIVSFSDGDIIFKIHDPADYAYFILSGNVVIDIQDENGTHKTELGKGSLFGELGVLNQTKRKGTAFAKGPLKLLSYDIRSFKKLYEASPMLRQYVSSLKTIYQINSVYQIGHSGTVNVYSGTFLKTNAFAVIYNLDDGSIVKAVKAIGNLAFNMSRNDNKKEVKIYHFRKGIEIRRKIGVVDQKIVSVLSFGEWGELNEICSLILNPKPIPLHQIELFIKTGNLGIGKLKILSEEERQEILCNCLNITKGQICNAISGGPGGLEDIIKKTGAGSVCGTCRPKIVELFGLKAWTIVKLIKKISLHPNICSFRFQPHQKEKINYKPGQYIIISALINGQFINRSYTLTSVSLQDPYVEITVKKEPKGNFSPWLFDQAEESSIIRISDPSGNFVLEDDEDSSPIVCFVGGIGVTPAIAFARYLSSKSKKTLHIDYSAKTKADFILLDEWNELSSKNKKLTIHFRATESEGRIEPNSIKKAIEDFPNASFYICGPGPYEQFVVSHLSDYKIPPFKIKTEKFIQAGSPTSALIRA